MQISMKCSVAVHCLIFIYEAKGKSQGNQQSAGAEHRLQSRCDPKCVQCAEKSRNVSTRLPAAPAGRNWRRPPSDITLYMIYQALEPDGLSSLIGIHSCRDRKCPVAQNIHLVLQKPYGKIEDAIRKTMEGITLEEMIEDFHERLAEAD